MNKIIIKIAAILGAILLVSGCQPTRSYSYLMQHPSALEKEYARCRGCSSLYCEEVVRAAEEFRALVEQCSEDPELFALQIMRAQQSGDAQKVEILYAVVRAASAE